MPCFVSAVQVCPRCARYVSQLDICVCCVYRCVPVCLCLCVEVPLAGSLSALYAAAARRVLKQPLLEALRVAFGDA